MGLLSMGLRFVESHFSQRTREMGHPTFVVSRDWITGQVKGGTRVSAPHALAENEKAGAASSGSSFGFVVL